jgi:FKBP-type peptidyl-prolyl cis-trans isomerase 2
MCESNGSEADQSDSDDQQGLAAEMLSNVPERHEITIDGVSDECLAALREANANLNHGLSGVTLSLDVNVEELTEDRTEDLLEELTAVEDKRAGQGDHERADAALEIKQEIRQEARLEGVIDD